MIVSSMSPCSGVSTGFGVHRQQHFSDSCGCNKSRWYVFRQSEGNAPVSTLHACTCMWRFGMCRLHMIIGWHKKKFTRVHKTSILNGFTAHVWKNQCQPTWKTSAGNWCCIDRNLSRLMNLKSNLHKSHPYSLNITPFLNATPLLLQSPPQRWTGPQIPVTSSVKVLSWTSRSRITPRRIGIVSRSIRREESSLTTRFVEVHRLPRPLQKDLFRTHHTTSFTLCSDILVLLHPSPKLLPSSHLLIRPHVDTL